MSITCVSISELECHVLIGKQLGKAPLWNSPLTDWQQQTTPQKGLNDESVLFSQGHTLGGGSARNFM